MASPSRLSSNILGTEYVGLVNKACCNLSTLGNCILIVGLTMPPTVLHILLSDLLCERGAWVELR